jgi:hypothetical protein
MNPGEEKPAPSEVLPTSPREIHASSAMTPFGFVAMVFQPARLADWEVGVTAKGFMESLDLQEWTRIGAMNREWAVASASASWSAAVLCRYANATRWRKRQRTAALQDLAEHWAGSWKAVTSAESRTAEWWIYACA